MDEFLIRRETLPCKHTLIFGTCYIGTVIMKCHVELWCKLMRKLNPETDILLIDSCSIYSPQEFAASNGINFIDFGNNVGHLSLQGRDGWGRAFCKGIQYAIDNNYKYVVYTDADIFLSFPVKSVIDKMERTNVKICTPFDITYLFIENGVVFADVNYMNESRFISKYDWENANQPIPEHRCASLWQDELFILPILGFRNDSSHITHQNVENPQIQYLTHCKDFSLYQHFLESRGIML